MMNKIRLTLSGCLLVALLSMATAPAYAAPHLNAAGSFDYWPDMATAVVRQAHGNTFIHSTTTDLWTGTFAGAGQSESTVIMFAAGSAVVTIRGTINCTLDGKHGVVTMQSVGRRAAGAAEWQGQWVIIRATGDLANMHGQGNWWGPGFNPADPNASPDIYYAGQIHFGPN
jgi:hypothetical protein